jgi:predicted nucleic acid-binding protein
MKEQEKETGQSVLMLGQLFHEKILFIKRQLNFNEHPIRQIIEKFKVLFCDSNLILLCKSAAEECKDDLTVSTH